MGYPVYADSFTGIILPSLADISDHGAILQVQSGVSAATAAEITVTNSVISFNANGKVRDCLAVEGHCRESLLLPAASAEFQFEPEARPGSRPNLFAHHTDFNDALMLTVVSSAHPSVWHADGHHPGARRQRQLLAGPPAPPPSASRPARGRRPLPPARPRRTTTSCSPSLPTSCHRTSRPTPGACHATSLCLSSACDTRSAPERRTCRVTALASVPKLPTALSCNP